MGKALAPKELFTKTKTIYTFPFLTHAFYTTVFTLEKKKETNSFSNENLGRFQVLTPTKSLTAIFGVVGLCGFYIRFQGCSLHGSQIQLSQVSRVGIYHSPLRGPGTELLHPKRLIEDLGNGKTFQGNHRLR